MKIIDKLMTPRIQNAINNRFKSNEYKLIPTNSMLPIKYIETDDAKFIMDDMFTTIQQVNDDYFLEDIRSTDVVMDIGACIGGFSLKICKKVSRVIAVEPILTDRLKENIVLNNCNNIQVIQCALGVGDISVKWNGTIKHMIGNTLTELISYSGGHIDFLKMDCEGGEWCIKPQELSGIRRIEGEIHSFIGMPKLSEFEVVLQLAGFNYTTQIISRDLMLVHAWRRT